MTFELLRQSDFAIRMKGSLNEGQEGTKLVRTKLGRTKLVMHKCRDKIKKPV